MLLKLLKYDIKAVWKLALTVAIIAIGASFAGGLSYSAYYNGLRSSPISPFIFVSLVGYAVSIFAVVAANVTISIVVYMRFYKNLFTDEGYLTFTLPASRKQILLAKTLNTVIWAAFQLIMIFACVCIYTALAPKDHIAIGESILSSFSSLVEFDYLWDVFSAIFLSITVIAISIFSLCLVQLCIALGAMLAKRAKLIAGIALYILISGGAETVMQIFIVFETIIYEIICPSSVASASAYSHAITMGIMFVNMLLSFGALFLTHFFTQRIIDKKLNLA